MSSRLGSIEGPRNDSSSDHGKSVSLLRPFYPALDGLRACAFLAVFMDHYVSRVIPWRIFPWGWVGVDIFFVLSGFLITGILYDSLHRKNYFKNFYIRRSLRIFPLYYTFWFGLLLLTPLLHCEWNRYNLSSLLYLQNFLLLGAARGLHPSPGHIVFHLNHVFRHPQFLEATTLWSLCVEEHFYLLWPGVVFLLRSRRKLLAFSLAIIVMAPIVRAIYIHLRPEMLQTGVLYSNSFSRFDTLLVGAALALWLRGNPPPLATLRRYAFCALFGCPLLLIGLLMCEKSPVGDGRFDPIISTVGFSLIAVASAGLLLLALERESALARVLQLRPLASLGRISYGLYFWHALPHPIFLSLIPSFSHRHLALMVPLLSFGCTLLLAILSFHYIESPFLRLKNRWAPTTGHRSDPAPDRPHQFKF